MTNTKSDLTTPNNDRSTRRRSGGSSERLKENNDTVKVIFTGLVPTQKHKKMISDIGAQLVESIEDAATATHVIASDGKTKLRRTPKLMICICKTSQILSIRWLEQSAKLQRVLDTADFLVLDDKEAEKTYNFSMSKTLESGKKARLERGGVLGGWFVYICSGVAGNNAPSSEEMNLVVKATGATLLHSLEESEDRPADPTKTIIVMSDPSTAAQRSEKGVKRVSKLGAKVLSTADLFHTIITQQLPTEIVVEVPITTQRNKRKTAELPQRSGDKRKRTR